MSDSYKMLAVPIMPTTPLLNAEKRRLGSRLEDMYVPEPKRRRTDSKIVQEVGPGNNIKSISESQDQRGLFLSYAPPVCLPPLRRTASLKAELQLSLLYNDNSRRHLFTEPQVSLSSTDSAIESTDKDSQKKPDVVGELIHKEVDKGDGRIPVVNLKNNGVKRKSVSPMVERITALSTQNHTNSDVDSDCSESGRTSILKSKIKQPAIVLTKMTQPIKKKATPSSSPAPRPITPVPSLNVVGGYLHRMASLNARACVSAYLEPERKFSPKHKKIPSAPPKPALPNPPVSKDNSDSVPSAAPKPALPSPPVSKDNSDSECKTDSSVSSICKVYTEAPKSKPVVVNLNGNESVIPIIKFDRSGSPSTLIIKELDDDSNVPYNREGLLYNGDSIHPDAQVFVADDKKLQLPKRIIPTLVPARPSTVKRAVKRATSIGILPSSKKHSKVSECRR